MDAVLGALALAAGLAMLCYGGSWLVSGGVGIARRLGMNPLVIGMTVVAYGTSTPELAASIAAGEHGAIILGNVAGSNIANVGLVIGAAAVIAPLAIARRTFRVEIPLVIAFSLLLAALSADGQITRADGGVLVAALVAFTALVYMRTARTRGADSDPAGGGAGAGTARLVALVAAGAALLGGGAYAAIEGAVGIAETLGVPERIIGLTVIAIGTSLPELITSVIAVRRGHTDIGVGNIIGSNIYNVLMIVGVASILVPISVGESVMSDYVIMIAFSAALYAAYRQRSVRRPVGAALVAAYAAYLALVGLF